MVSGLTLGYITFEESESVSDNFSVSKRKRGISRLASRQESGSRLAMVWCQFHGGGSIMSDQFTSEYFSRQAQEASEPDPRAVERRKRRRRFRLIRRVAISATVALVVIAGALVGGSYLVVNHLASSIHRINGVVALTAADQPLVPAKFKGSMTILLTGSATEPSERGGRGADGSSTAGEYSSGLIALIHLNANHRGGAVVSIPANALVAVHGHGNVELGDTLALGGPSLLIKTVESLTGDRINHYSVLDFGGASAVIKALHGVDVDVPYTTTSLGHTFPAGINDLTANDVLAYARQPEVSEIGREQLQSNLIRAMLSKIAKDNSVSTDYHVMRALAAVLSVDSDFSDSQLTSLALQLRHLHGPDGAFVTAATKGGSASLGGDNPVHLNRRLDAKLWRAIRTDSVAEFARDYPSTITPVDPG
jgi:LCP family protein required for cell wall assembly